MHTAYIPQAYLQEYEFVSPSTMVFSLERVVDVTVRVVNVLCERCILLPLIPPDKPSAPLQLIQNT